MTTEFEAALAAVNAAHQRWLGSVTGKLVTELDRLIAECKATRHARALDRSRALLAQLRGEKYSGLSVADIDKMINIADRRIRALENERDRAVNEDIARTGDELRAGEAQS